MDMDLDFEAPHKGLLGWYVHVLYMYGKLIHECVSQRHFNAKYWDIASLNHLIPLLVTKIYDLTWNML